MKVIPVHTGFKALRTIAQAVKPMIAIVCCMQMQPVSAQTKILDVEQGEKDAGRFGQNLKHFVHIYMGGGFIAGASEPGAPLKYTSSGSGLYGIRYKMKISNAYAWGYEIFYNATSYGLKQDSTKIIPYVILHDKESYNTGALGLMLYNRFNFYGVRGNAIGYYMDIGISGEWNIRRNTFSKDKLPGGLIIETTTRKIPYINPLASHVILRVGYQHVSFTGAYRITNFFFSSYHYPQMPKLILGLEIGIF